MQHLWQHLWQHVYDILGAEDLRPGDGPVESERFPFCRGRSHPDVDAYVLLLWVQRVAVGHEHRTAKSPVGILRGTDDKWHTATRTLCTRHVLLALSDFEYSSQRILELVGQRKEHQLALLEVSHRPDLRLLASAANSQIMSIVKRNLRERRV